MYHVGVRLSEVCGGSSRVVVESLRRTAGSAVWKAAGGSLGMEGAEEGAAVWGITKKREGEEREEETRDDGEQRGA